MAKKKIIKIIANSIYALGVSIVIVLCGFMIFGSNEPVWPNNMISLSYKELAFTYLVLGTLPMLSACVGAYNVNNITNSVKATRNTILISTPGIICALCMITVIVVFLIGIINMLITVT